MAARECERVEPHVEAVALGLVLFLGVVEGGAEPAAVGVSFREARLDLAELGAGGGERVLAFGEAAGQAGGFVERLVDRVLQRAFVVLKQRQLLARGGKLAFQFAVELLGGVVLVLQGAAALAQRAALRGLLRELAFKLGDLRVARRDVVGQLAACALQAAVGLAREFEVFAQLLHLGLQRGRALFHLVEFGAQRVVGGARLVEHAGQAQRLGFFLFERAQRRVERRDDLLEGVLEFVEFSNLAPGVGQQSCAATRLPRPCASRRRRNFPR